MRPTEVNNSNATASGRPMASLDPGGEVDKVNADRALSAVHSGYSWHLLIESLREVTRGDDVGKSRLQQKGHGPGGGGQGGQGCRVVPYVGQAVVGASGGTPTVTLTTGSTTGDVTWTHTQAGDQYV